MKIMGFLFSSLAGAFMSIQGVINTRLNSKIGLWEANAFVQGTAFLLSLLAAFIFGKGNFKEITSVPYIYLTGGVFGLLITAFVILGMDKMSPALTVSVILISQLIVAAIISAFGILGTEKVPFGTFQYIGIVLLIAGVIVFKIQK